MRSHLFTTIYLLLLISCGYLATDVYLPSLPAIAAYFQASDNQVQMTLFFYLVSFSVSPLIFGPLSDHVGRKKVILGGIAVSIAATAAALFMPHIQGLVACRFLQGLGLGAVLICSRSMVSDLFTGKALARQMSLTTMLMPLVLAIAPTVGGLLQETFQWQAVFIFLSVYLTLILFLVMAAPESLKQPSTKKFTQIFSTYRAHLSNRQFVVFGITFILPSIGLFAYMTVSPFLFQEQIGLSPSEYGSLALFVGAGILTTGFLNLKLIQYFSAIQLLFLGASLMIVSGGLLLVFYSMGIFTTWSLLIPSLIYFSCLAFCISNSAARAMSVVKEHFGAAAALLTTFQYVAGACGSFIFSLIPNETPLSLAGCFIAVGVLSLITLCFALRCTDQDPVLSY
ncbi:MAG: multidrug effflux MFS transporter [Parachlamydia sp.]|nr:multidrug effflux MFS transporter [Parachlamydia sp.]